MILKFLLLNLFFQISWFCSKISYMLFCLFSLLTLFLHTLLSYGVIGFYLVPSNFQGVFCLDKVLYVMYQAVNSLFNAFFSNFYLQFSHSIYFLSLIFF